jgi:hypothetical protein
LPHLPFPALTAHFASQVDGERTKLTINPSAKVIDYTHPYNLDLVFEWRAGEQQGLFHAVGLACAKPSIQACPLEYVLECPPIVKHDFSRGACVVPAKLRVRNTLEKDVTFLFETLHPSDVFNSHTKRFERVPDANLSGRYFWFGCTRKRVNALPSQQLAELELTVAIYQPVGYVLLMGSESFRA